MIKIRDIRTHFIDILAPEFGRGEAEHFFYLTLEDFHQMRRVDLALNTDMSVSEDQKEQWDLVLSQLRKHIPIQYILGTAHFYGRIFEVNESVLVPRPETEELVQWIISDCQNKNLPYSICDIGTGSGCIAVTLACELPGAGVTAIDVSPRALQTAERNAARYGVHIHPVNLDILEAEDLPRYDIIVSNPPYVRQLEKSEIKRNVVENEPHLALFVPDDDALVFYRKIAGLARTALNQDGALYVEINQYLAKETMDVLENAGFGSLQLRKDIYGNDRMIRAAIYS